jgi:3-oxo-5-alpha-steroid 4-dehydrogenase 3
MIFINLRKLKDGKVATETHSMPKGGWFEYVSSPHMTAEVGMYLTLYVLLFQNTSYIYCLSWVITNQLSNALLTHQWYKETFKNYPKERKALIPFVI